MHAIWLQIHNICLVGVTIDPHPLHTHKLSHPIVGHPHSHKPIPWPFLLQHTGLYTCKFQSKKITTRLTLFCRAKSVYHSRGRGLVICPQSLWKITLSEVIFKCLSDDSRLVITLSHEPNIQYLNYLRLNLRILCKKHRSKSRSKQLYLNHWLKLGGIEFCEANLDEG